MTLSAFRKLPLAVALMLGCAATTPPAQAGWFSSDPAPAAKADNKPAAQQPAATLDESIRQAQMLRLAGQYPEAIKHLSQVMMVASDDARVISEYGKTLAAMGRASDAVNFLTRAQQLQPDDWTVYSALGVAYDQLGDQKSAQAAYEHALAIKPEESSVLNNYALSRMLAKDPEMARNLAARAERAGGTSDAKIARNIVMIRSLVPEAPAASPVAQPAQMPVTHNQAPAIVTPATAVVGNAATVKVVTLPPVAQTPEAHDNRVVMQPVPVDPLAGPVRRAAKADAVVQPVPASAMTAAIHAPRPLQPNAPQAGEPQAKQQFAKPAVTAMAKAPVEPGSPANKPATSLSSPLASVKTAEAKLAPVKAAEPGKTAPVAVAKVAVPAPVKAADAKSALVKAAEADKMDSSVTLKMAPSAQIKISKIGTPAPAPKVLTPAPMKTTEDKPIAVKAAAKPKESIPGLRLSANAYE
jgi:Flp pilus assembly protein TadD